MNGKIEIVDLKVERRSQCRIQICQLSSSDFDWQVHNGLHILTYNEKIHNKIIHLLHVAKQNSVDLIIFPELSIPLKLIEKIQEWSKEHKTIIVGGSHYYQKGSDYISRCPIIINGEVFFSEKMTPSPLEKSPIQGEGLSRGSIIRKFINTSFGNIGILICSDYLDEEIKGNLDLQGLDILCVPSFQKQTQLYENRMNIDCENSKNGVYIIYSNFYDTNYGDGKSSLFGLMDKLYSEKLKEKQVTNLTPENKLIQLNNIDEFIICDLSLNQKRPFINRNIITEPNVILITKSSWSNQESIDFVKKIAHDDERYKRIDEYYVPPTEYNEILSILNNQKLIFITGDPGIGKTYTAVKLLKEFYELGYEPIWFAGLEKEERDTQVKHLATFSPSENQIVYFEDPFGRTVFERKDTLFQVFSPLLEKLTEFNSKIIITSRKEVFESFSSESLLEKDILDLKKELNVTNPSYNEKKLIQIFDRLASIYCDWYVNEDFRQVVYHAVKEKKLSTPLSIRDLVFASRGAKKIEDLELKIEKRETEMVKTFALEILGISPSSKLFLYLIFFGGYKGHSFLSEKYDKLIAAIKDQIPNIIGLSFNIELRSQIGYRVEQLGKIKTNYRFSHPVYEESLAMLAITDKISEVISKIIILNFAHDDVQSSFRIINKFVLKYPELALLLFKHLFDNKQALNDEGLRISLTQKLISIYYSSKEVKFFELAKSFYPLKELVDNLNEYSGIKKLGDKLNLIQRYKRNSPIDFDHSYSEKVNFTKIFEEEIKKISSPKKIVHTLFEVSAFNSSLTSKFIDSISPNLIKRTYFILKENERKRLLSLLPENRLKRDILRIEKKIKQEFKKGNKPRIISQFRILMFSEFYYDGEIYVDAGAEFALRKNWTNVLPVGITKIGGDFDAGVVIAVKNKQNHLLAVGLSEYSSKELKVISGHSSIDFYELLGYYRGPSAIKFELLLKLFRKKYEWKKWKRRHISN